MSRVKQAEVFATGFLVAGLASVAATAKLWTDGAEFGDHKMTAMGIVAVALIILGALGVWRIRKEEERAILAKRESDYRECAGCHRQFPIVQLWRFPSGTGSHMEGFPACADCMRGSRPGNIRPSEGYGDKHVL